MAKFDPAIPRRMYWSKDVGSGECCPKCRRPLESEFHSYLCAVRQGNDTQTFMVGNDAGYFCGRCSVIVLDFDAFAKSADAMAPSRSGSAEFVVMGMVDLDAIPPEKADVPFGEDDNPIPFKAFTNMQPPKKQQKKGKRHKRKKRRR